MTKPLKYQTAFIIAFTLHLLLAGILMREHHSNQFVLKSAPRTEVMETAMEIERPEEQTIQAVTVDSQAVNETLHRLKEERAQKKRAEINHQRAVDQQLRLAKQHRIQEQKRIEKMKKEAAALALEQKKKLAADRKHLKELADEKTKREQHLVELKQQQEALQKQQALEKKRVAEAEAARLKKEQEASREKARLAQEEKEKSAARRTAQMSGEVNKYKALIVRAISQHWILPEHVDRALFSKFRIRLAPNGTVLSVTLIRSSGDPVLDRSARAAIYKASPLPVPTEQAMFDLFRDISLTVRPESVRG
ncbi:MAG: cell envelope integrity protein TolA [Gammaproteobacteria bacterium]|nr:cell envelope integrity protein TolA [Gammaproteobacteria bacterium]